MSLPSHAEGGERATVRAMPEPPWWQVGQEPDYRYTLANERTFLAWVRTALGMLAGSIAVAELAKSVPQALRVAIAVSLALLAAGMSTAGFWQWRDRQRRMRLGMPLGRTRLLPVLSVSLLALCLLVAAVAIIASR
jgi:putative membrane protein